ncbi:MAG: response regulator [Chloroflexales bacterium]|nr:response regulator [Chloroflexales bacterium]
MTTRPATILVVDDDYGIREVLSEVLNDEGYQVVTAADGEEALRYLQCVSSLPCVILLDLMMPVMTGWEFRLAQQQDPRLAPIPVVALSARTSITHATYEVAVDAFIQKPVDLERLLALLEGYCG